MGKTNEGTVDEGIRKFFFEKYTTSGKSGGTGLGTHSARLMTEAQGGKISLHTDDGPTVTVKVELPLEIIKAGDL